MQREMRFILLFTTATLHLAAQSELPLSFGFKLGSPINTPDRNSWSSTYTQGRWTGGPTVELHLPYRFSIEFDALYLTTRATDSFQFQFGPNVNPLAFTNRRETSEWNFPLMLKYRFHVGSVRPFLTAGYYWLRESNEESSLYHCLGPQGSCIPSDSPFPQPLGGQRSYTATVKGVVGGAGIEFRTKHVMISPEVRFSRPTNGTPRDNRFTALVGFTFGRRP
jgi:hypothetical protein